MFFLMKLATWIDNKVENMHIVNQVFRRKTLVNKMMNVGGRAGVNNSFPEHNSATVRNILTILGRIKEQVNTECRVQE